MTKEAKAVKGNERIAALLNRILEYELAGVVRYTHYSLMVFGYNRLPIISWLSGQADESLAVGWHFGGSSSNCVILDQLNGYHSSAQQSGTGAGHTWIV